MRRMLIDPALMFPAVLCVVTLSLLSSSPQTACPERVAQIICQSPPSLVSSLRFFFPFPPLQPSSQTLLAADFLIPILSPLHSTLGLALKLLCTTCSSNPIFPTSSLYSSPSWFLHRSFGCFPPSLPLYSCVFLDICITDVLCYFYCSGHDAILVF